MCILTKNLINGIVACDRAIDSMYSMLNNRKTMPEVQKLVANNIVAQETKRVKLSRILEITVRDELTTEQKLLISNNHLGAL